MDEQLALRDRLQEVEDALMQHGRRRVIAATPLGMFGWAVKGAPEERPQAVFVQALPDIEREIIRQGWDDIVVTTEHGFFQWVPEDDLEDQEEV